MRIVRLANFVGPHSGGLCTSLRELGEGYLAAGHDPVLIIPGELDSDQQTTQGRVITLRGPRVPFGGGYRVLLRRRPVAALLSELSRTRSRCRTGPRCAGPAAGPARRACPR
jgi:alpha-1,6-mannosyltransferase